MKFEIDISEDMIQTVIERKAQEAVKEFINSFSVESAIRDMVREEWAPIAQRIIIEEVNNSDKLRTMVQTALTNKIKAQLNAVMREAKETTDA